MSPFWQADKSPLSFGVLIPFEFLPLGVSARASSKLGLLGSFGSPGPPLLEPGPPGPPLLEPGLPSAEAVDFFALAPSPSLNSAFAQEKSPRTSARARALDTLGAAMEDLKFIRLAHLPGVDTSGSD